MKKYTSKNGSVQDESASFSVPAEQDDFVVRISRETSLVEFYKMKDEILRRLRGARE